MAGEQAGQSIAVRIFISRGLQGRPSMNTLRRGNVQYVVHQAQALRHKHGHNKPRPEPG